MNILDENIIKNQTQLLRGWRISFRQIGVTIGTEGIKDDEIISLLHGLQRSTFFTRDDDFFNRNLCHSKYCIVYLAVRKEESAIFIRRFLRFKKFNAINKRLGCVIRITHSGLSVWRKKIEEMEYYTW